MGLVLLTILAQARQRGGIDLFWEDGAARQAAGTLPATAQLRQARALSLDVSALDAALVPARRGAEVVLVLVLPLPDGRSARFGVREASVMDAPTAARFPELRTYRLAVAATAEYTAEYTANRGGTVASAQAAIMTTVNHVTGVYERERPCACCWYATTAASSTPTTTPTAW